MLQNSRPATLIIRLVVMAVIAITAFSGCSDLVPNTGGSGDLPAQADNPLGNMYVASQIDQSGCPVEQATRFDSNETVYVGTQPSNVPAGTAIFARLLYEGEAVEDTREITADQNLRGTCVWFQFSSNQGLEPGRYAAELIVNGSRVDRVQFVVEDSAGRGGGFFNDNRGNSAAANADLGNMVITDRVDSDGCPARTVRRFDARDTIVAALEESYIPEGTQMFARLVYEGEIIEDTDPIFADRDMETCVWFAFESNDGRGFAPGDYEAHIYMNGSRVERETFVVR